MDQALDSTEQARFFRAGPGGIDCLTATFRTHRFARHEHETFVVGTILAGCGTLMIRGARRYAGPGDLTLYDPGLAHDGEPHGPGGFTYRVCYPPAGLVAVLAADMADRVHTVRPSFPEPVVRDPDGARRFAAAHARLEAGDDPLEADELMTRALAHGLARHAGVPVAAAGREPRRVARVKARLADAEAPSLADLAAEAGVTPHHLIRAFRAETGMTPHAWLIGRRIEAAKARLRRGEPVADVAAATGFCDQAHLTRIFKARVGVTPGAFRALAL